MANKEKKDIVIAENRSFEGVWIPKKLYITNKFNLRTKFFVVEVKSLSKNGYCFATDKHFADFLGISERMVQTIIKQLKDDEYLTAEYKYKEGTNSIERRYLILTKKFLDEFYNEDEAKPIEKNFNTPTEINCEGGTEKNYGEKYNNNFKYNKDSSNTDKYAFSDKSSKGDMYAFVSEKQKAEPKSQKKSRYIPKDYTEEQLIEHIKPVIDNYIDQNCDRQDKDEIKSNLLEVIAEFYGEYEKKFGEKHRILADVSYENIAERFLNPPEILDGIYDVDAYSAMMEQYFIVEFNKRKKYNGPIEISLSHFMSDEIRGHLYWQTCV